MITYTVRSGDTLFSIANRFGTTVEELVRLNNIANPNAIQVGQVLIIRRDGTEPTPGPTPSPAPASSPAPVTDTTQASGADPSATRLVNGLLYIISTDQATYRRGEPVQITFIKLNVSAQTITLNYNTAQRFDIFVLRDNREVFRLSRGRVFAQVTGQVTLRPGQFQVFRFVWDQRNDQGNLVAIDEFSVCAENVARGFAGRAVCVPINIIPAVTPTPTPRPTPTPCPPGNLLQDPSIEQWVTQNQPRIWRGSNLFRTSISRTGNFAGELGAIHNRSAALFQQVGNAPGGVRYRLAFWAREDIQPRNVANYTVMAEILFFDRFGRIVDRADLRLVPRDIPDNNYRRFVQTSPVINRAATSARVQFIFVPAVNNDNTVKIDDVELVCIP